MGLAALAVTVLALLIAASGRIGAGPRTEPFLVDRVQLCETTDLCGEFVTLPWQQSAAFDDVLTTAILRAEVPTAAFGDDLPAILLPRMADRAEIRVNGTLVSFDIARQARFWNQPLFTSFGRAALTGGTETIDIHLSAEPATRLALDPFHVGSGQSIYHLHQIVVVARMALTRTAFGAAAFSAILFPLFWFANRSDRIYLWLGLTNLFALPAIMHWVWRADPAPPADWFMWWGVGLLLSAYCFHRFVAALQGRTAHVPVHTGFGLAIAMLLVCLALPLEPAVLTMRSALGIALAAMLWPLGLLAFGVVPWRDWPLFALMAVTLATTWLNWLSYVLPDPPFARTLASSGTFAFMVGMLWLIFCQLFRTIRNYESLTGELQDRVARRTAELHETYARLAESDRRRTLEEERQRIMLDLHDGVGGQLANTLAYMGEKHDPVLRDALEDALRDLAMTVDSLEPTESVADLLSNLRERLEPLLSARGLRFDWNIEGEPHRAATGPSQNLTLLRIVQEAVTNSVKHSGARVIAVHLTEQALTIQDDGSGFDPAAPAIRRGLDGGFGLVGMRRRADQIGARLSIESDKDGTAVSLHWD